MTKNENKIKTFQLDGRSPLSRKPINDLGLGGDIRIGCQRIPASVLDYAREWAKE